MSEDPKVFPIHILTKVSCDYSPIYGSQQITKVMSTVSNLKDILRDVVLHKKKYYGNNLFVTPILPRPVIYLYGAGTCGIALCSAAPLGNFDVHVFDDREDQMNRLVRETTNKDITTEVTGVDGSEILGTGKALIENCPEESYVVIMTRGHKFDYLVLQQVMNLSVEPHYVGMIGSSHKIKAVYDRLESQGVSKEKLEKVHAPIGLPIGGDTPGEIAIAVMAQLVLSRTDGKKGSFSGLHE